MTEEEIESEHKLAVLSFKMSNEFRLIKSVEYHAGFICCAKLAFISFGAFHALTLAF